MKEKTETTKIAAKDPLALAFIGDAVWTLMVRETLIGTNDFKVGELHARTSSMVCATAQSNFLGMIEPLLTETEQEIARRARNAHNNTIPKNATLASYKRATAFEAVIGYNHLCNNKQRIDQLLNESKIVLELQKLGK